MPPSMSSTPPSHPPDLMSDGWDLQNILANLAARVGQLEGSMKVFMDNWGRQDQLAHDGRRVMYDRLELLSNQINRIAVDVQNSQQDIAELRKEIEEQVMPTIDTVQNRRHQQAGAKSVWAMIGAGVVAFASALAYLADKLVQYIRHP
jgi:hypothetical protein